MQILTDVVPTIDWSTIDITPVMTNVSGAVNKGFIGALGLFGIVLGISFFFKIIKKGAH